MRALVPSNAVLGAARRPGMAGIWALGLVSMFMDLSSEMIHGLLPVYMVGVLGASSFQVGIIEGLAESAAAIVKVFSGALSDWLGRRKLLAAVGYGLAALTRPVFPLAGSLGWLVAARLTDRVGKGIRGAPRDALVADLAPPALLGAAFGLRQSLDTIGAFLGPLLAIALMAASGGDFRLVFWIAGLPALISLGLIVFAVREPARAPGARAFVMPLHTRELRRLGGTYGWIVGVACVFTLARFSEAFLVLRARDVGVPLAATPAVLVVMNLAYAASAYPLGVLSDRLDRISILVAGLGLLVAADLVLALSPGWSGLAIGVVLWGLHMGFTQGLFATLVADCAPADLRGTAFGMFNLFTGAAMLAASAIAGTLWQAAGPSATFLAGAVFAAVTAAALAPLRSRLRRGPLR